MAVTRNRVEAPQKKKSDGINDKKILELWNKYMNKKVLLTSMEQVS
jgi:hypothetical protein